MRTGVAGEILQKSVTYRLRVAIVGDISKHVLLRLRVSTP
jgi:hypothetical protein